MRALFQQQKNVLVMSAVDRRCDCVTRQLIETVDKNMEKWGARWRQLVTVTAFMAKFDTRLSKFFYFWSSLSPCLLSFVAVKKRVFPFQLFCWFRLLQVLFSRLLSGLFRFSNSNNSSSRLLFIDVNYFNFFFCLNKNLGCCSVCLQLARLHKSGEWWAEVPKKFCWLAGWHGWNVWCKYVEWTPWDKRTTRPTSPVEPDSPVAALSH